jgi:hypothetical protein
MLERFKRFLNPASPKPQFDEEVRQRLEREGRNPQTLVADAAEPLEIPPKPHLDGFAGLVRLDLTLDAAGVVQSVQMEGAPFNEVAQLESWAYAWTFKPALLDGKPHPCRMTFEVHWS